jgi:hypothetical protein
MCRSYGVAVNVPYIGSIYIIEHGRYPSLGVQKPVTGKQEYTKPLCEAIVEYLRKRIINKCLFPSFYGKLLSESTKLPLTGLEYYTTGHNLLTLRKLLLVYLTDTFCIPVVIGV